MFNQINYYLQTNKTIYHNILSKLAKEAIQKMLNLTGDNELFNTLCQLPKPCNVARNSNLVDVRTLFVEQIRESEFNNYLSNKDFINDIFTIGKVKQAKTEIPLNNKKRVLKLLLKYMNEPNFYGMIIEINNDKIITLSHPLRLFEYIYYNYPITDIITNIVIYYSPDNYTIEENPRLSTQLTELCYEFKLVYKNILTKNATIFDKNMDNLTFKINPNGKKIYNDFNFSVHNIASNTNMILLPVDILNKDSYVPYYGVLQIETDYRTSAQTPITIKYAPTGNIAWRTDVKICCGTHSSNTVEGLLTLCHFNANSTYYEQCIHPQYMTYVTILLNIVKTQLTQFLSEINNKTEINIGVNENGEPISE